MAKFGTLSEKHLRTCDPRLQILFREVVQTYDCTIVVGHRGQQEQDKAFAEGNSTKKWPDGNHNKWPSLAADVAPYPIEWGGPIVIDGKLNEENLRALKRFYHFSGYVQGKASEMGIKLRWGGDWNMNFNLDDQAFFDLVHFELVGE